MTPDYFVSIINSYLPEPHASLLNGIIFGIPIRTYKPFYLQLQHAGLLHIVVLSGMNISILGNTIGSLTQTLPKKISIVVSIVAIILFTLFVGPQPPIVRAAIMGSLSLIAVLYGKRNAALLSLFIAIVLVAVFKPEWMSSVSFQLSVAATLGIICFGSMKYRKFTSPLKKMIFGCMQEIRVTLAATAFTGPLILWYFRQISFICPLTNLAVSWVIAPLMLFGTIMCLFGSIHYVLGLPISYICYALLEYMVVIIDFSSRIPFAYLEF